MNGPYETSREAFDAARVLRETVAAADPDSGLRTRSIAARSAARVQYVRGVLEVCGVQVGAYDKRIAEWVAGWDIETIQTITSWIQRAHGAGQDALREEIADLDTRTTSLEAAAYVHALPGIDLPGRLAGAHRGPRCGAEGRTALFAHDVTCPACVALLEAEGTR